jgi:molybdate-binding protein
MVQSEIMIHENKLDFMLYKHESYQIIINPDFIKTKEAEWYNLRS